MKEIRLKWPCKIGDTLYPKGTPLESAKPSGVFAGLKENPESNTVCVLFPGEAKSILISYSQIEIMEVS